MSLGVDCQLDKTISLLMSPQATGTSDRHFHILLPNILSKAINWKMIVGCSKKDITEDKNKHDKSYNKFTVQ